MSAVAYTATRWRVGPQRRLLPPDWPIGLVCAGMPLTFLLGVHGLVWIVPVFVLGLRLVMQREPVVVPRSALPLLLLVLWIPVPMLQLEPDALPLAVFRWLLFASPLACWLWLVNQREELLPTARIVRLLSILWIALIGFGILAILFPYFSMTSPIQRVIPGGLLANEYLRDVTIIRFAQLEELVATQVGRPAAPMAYSNGWGSTVGLLTPFFLLDFFVLGSARRHRYGYLVAAIGAIPIVLSLNRGLWLSLSIAVAYVALRRALQGSVRVAMIVSGVILLVVVILAATALGSIVQQRFEIASESNNARTALYEVAFDAAQDRPLFGWGAPIEVAGLWKEVGTHGLLWFVMVCYGFPGLVFLLLWIAGMLVSSARAPNATALWAHAAIVVFLVQIPIYGLLPQIMVVGIAIAIVQRAQRFGAEGPAPLVGADHG
jgi:hypothetical protein